MDERQARLEKRKAEKSGELSKHTFENKAT